MTNDAYVQLMLHKRWADQELCSAIADGLGLLDQSTDTYLRMIMDHIHSVDVIFQHHLTGRPHGYRAPRSDTLPDWDALFPQIRRLDDWFCEYAWSLPSAAWHEPLDFTFTSGRPARMRRDEILLHVSVHGTYHRGNAGVLLQQKALAPGRNSITDYLEDIDPVLDARTA